MSEEEVKALVEMKDMLKAENTKLKQKLEEQTKTYQKILQEQQNEIDQLERNCDVFTEQMNDAVERTVELNKEKQELKEWLEEETELEGVKNYKLKEFYLPVLDRNYIDKFNPLKTCISLCGNEKFELNNEDEFIKKVIKSVEDLKWYHLNNMHGQNENIGEYSLFQILKMPDSYMLNSYTIQKDTEEEYYLILWITPQYYAETYHKHLYWYGKNHNDEWY